MLRDWLGGVANGIAIGLMALGIAMVFLFWGRLYTMSSFGLMVVLLGLHVFIFKSAWLGRFFVAFLVSLIPFVIVNGVLTGAVTDAPVVWYNDAENLGLRFGTIPMDDFVYGMDLMLMNVSLFEWFKWKLR